MRDLGKEVRLAERISNRCNPPKPERESKRKKQKKELNEDFVDITQGNAFFFLGGRGAAKKKAPATPKTKVISEDAKIPVDKIESSPFDFTLEVAPKSSEKPTKKRSTKIRGESQAPKQLRLKLPLKPETSPYSLQEQPPSANAYDLTDQVS